MAEPVAEQGSEQASAVMLRILLVIAEVFLIALGSELMAEHDGARGGFEFTICFAFAMAGVVASFTSKPETRSTH